MPEFDPGNILVYLYELLGWWLTSAGVIPAAVTVIQALIGIVVLATVVLLLPIFTIWLERKLAGRFQERLGPNRVGPFGLLQSFADVLKLLVKEAITPSGADKVVYNLAPLLSVVSVITIWAVVPFASTMVGANINVGLLYVVAVSGLGTISIMMGGWASNNKFALLGAFRTVAQLVSYEVPMIIALLVPVILTGSMGMQDIVNAQRSAWFVFLAPVAALIFFVSSVAEIGRAPFDLLEAESEIATGYNIEYSGMKFGMWMLGEFLHAFTIGAVTAVVFLGGWDGPFAREVPILGVVYFFAKAFAAYFVVVWLRLTFPRIRIDHLLSFNWKFLVPVSLGALMVTALVDKGVAELLPASGLNARLAAHLAANALFVLLVGELIRRGAREARAAEEALAAGGAEDGERQSTAAPAH